MLACLAGPIDDGPFGSILWQVSRCSLVSGKLYWQLLMLGQFIVSLAGNLADVISWKVTLPLLALKALVCHVVFA